MGAEKRWEGLERGALSESRDRISRKEDWIRENDLSCQFFHAPGVWITPFISMIVAPKDSISDRWSALVSSPG